MDNIKNILPDVFRGMLDRKPLGQEKIDRVWSMILQSRDAGHTAIVGIKNGILSINTDTPTWLYHLRLRRKKILESLQEEIPEISDIRFQIGKIK